MTRLTKKDSRRLSNIKKRLDDAIKFIERREVKIIGEHQGGCMPSHTYINQGTGKRHCNLTKFTGSNLHQLLNARRDISNWIESDSGG